jgi:hypothetical protein
LSRVGMVLVLFTTLLVGRMLCAGSVAVALVKVNVKYWVSSIFQAEMIQAAWMAFE